MKIIKLLLLGSTTLFSVLALAQEKKIDVDIDVNKGGASNGAQWFSQPWVWVVGGAIFILLLVIVLKSGRKSE